MITMIIDDDDDDDAIDYVLTNYDVDGDHDDGDQFWLNRWFYRRSCCDDLRNKP